MKTNVTYKPFLAIVFLITSCLIARPSSSQATPDVEQGFKPYGSYQGGDIDTVNLSNGNLTLHIPLLSYPQLGKVKLDFALVYNAQPWRQILTQGGTSTPTYVEVWGGVPCTGAGVYLISSIAWCGTVAEYNNLPPSPLSPPAIVGINSPVWGTDGPPDCSNTCSEPSVEAETVPVAAGIAPIQNPTSDATAYWDLFTYYDPFGGSHQFVPTSKAMTTYTSLDATGMQLGSGVVTPDGVTHYMSGDVDRFGNVVKFNVSSGGAVQGWTDSTGRVIPAPVSTNVGSCPTGTTTATSWTVPAYASGGGGSATYTSCFTVLSIASNFPFGNQAGLAYPHYTNGTASPSLLTALVLPNGQQWTFSYDSKGDLQQLTFPTGGSISYTWAAIPACNLIQMTTFSMGVTSRTVNPGNGGPSATWTYTPTGGSNTVVDPLGNTTIHTFTSPGGCSQYETNTAYYQGSIAAANLIKQVATQYSGTTNPNDSGATAMNVVPTSITTTLASGQQSTSVKTFDSGIAVWNQTWNRGQSPVYYPLIYGSLLSTAEYDFGVATTGTPSRIMGTAWLWQQNPAYLIAGLLNLPASTQVLNSSGAQASYTTYAYDETSYSPGGTLGLPTTTVRYLGTNPGPTSHTGWLSNGEKSYVIDPDAHTNSYGHTVDYRYSECGGSVVTDTYDALNHHASGSYDCNSGLATSITDPNGQTSQYSYDNLSRLTQVQAPSIMLSRGQTGNPTTTFQYNDSAKTVTRTVLATPDPAQTTEVAFDGLGREIHRYITDSPQSDTIDTSYDLLGRVASVSNPYRSASDSTYGTVSFTYDALGRKIIQTQPDGSALQWCYDGVAATTAQTICATNKSSSSNASWVDYADETGKHWQHVSDSFGNLIAAVEPSPTSNTPTLRTAYIYNALNELMSVNQIGVSGETPHTRSFTYDSLSRLLCASNPENNNPNSSQGNTVQLCPASSTSTIPGTGVTSYSYDPNGNVILKTDARGVSTSISYDNLNRPLSKSYNDGVTLPVSYTYDSSSVAGATNTIGRLTSETVLSGTTPVSKRLFYAYDALGEVNAVQECSLANCSGTSYQASYLYDLAGRVNSSTNGLPASTFNGASVPSVTFSSSYDLVGRLNVLQSSWTSSAAYPQTLFQAGSTDSTSPSYTAAGALQSALLGVNSSTLAPIASLVRSYDDRLRLISETDSRGATIPGTFSTGSISISGSEQSATTAATYATGSITITGTEGSQIVCITEPHGGRDCNSQPDTGSLSVAINGYVGSASYGAGSTDASVASALAASLSMSGSPVSATTAGGSVITLKSLIAGSAGDYAFTVSNGAVFFGSGGTLSGGAVATTTYDAGSISVGIGSASPVVVNWGQGSTVASLVTALKTALSGSTVTAAVSSNVVTLTSQATGTASNVALSCAATHTGTTPISFSTACSGMTGGTAGSANALIYSYSIPSGTGYASNGNLMSVTDSVTGAWNYAYDSLNRLTTATGASGTLNGIFGIAGISVTWTYDSFGNRKTQSSTSGNIPTTWANYTASTNQFTTDSAAVGGVTYDNAGDVTYDGANYYAYDAEGRVCAALSQAGAYTGYLYDAEGNRAAKGSINSLSCNLASNGFSLTKSYIYGAKGELLTEMDAGGAWDHSNVYANGALLATYHDTNTYFEFHDWLGTKRAELSATASCLSTYGSLFFGDDLSSAGTCPDAAEQHYTGKERDTESGLDYFGARYYGSNMGRFMSPDPLPWIHWQHGDDDDRDRFEAYIANPQNFNMYAYVNNNPLNKTDPTGMNACGTSNDSTCHVTITIQDRSKDANGHYNDQFAGLSHQGEYNATATVNVNGKDVDTFLVKTTPDDSSKSATLKAGVYDGTFVMHKGKYAAIAIGGVHGEVPTVGPNPSRKDGASIAIDIHIHHAGLGDAAYARHGPPVSEGCQVVCTSQYSTFQRVTGIVPTAGAPQNAFTIDIRTSANEPQ